MCKEAATGKVIPAIDLCKVYQTINDLAEACRVKLRRKDFSAAILIGKRAQKLINVHTPDWALNLSYNRCWAALQVNLDVCISYYSLGFSAAVPSNFLKGRAYAV